MYENAFEITKDDILIVLRSHDTQLTEEQLEEVFDALDIDLIINSCLNYQTLEDQTNCALAQIEHQMILDGLYITEPYRFNLPS
jgi:hypothetical protein